MNETDVTVTIEWITTTVEDIVPKKLLQSFKKEEKNKFLVPHLEDKYNSYFHKLTELRAGDIIVVTQCKLCNHEIRAEAEEKWEATKGHSGTGSFAMVIKFLNDRVPEMKFGYQNVKMHLVNHYEQQIKRVRLREYGKHLAEIVNYKIAKEEMFEGLIQSLQLSYYETASDNDLEPYKRADMQVKLSKSILDICLVQAKLRGEINDLDVYKEKMQNIIINFISSEKNVEKKRELLEKLDAFRSCNSD